MIFNEYRLRDGSLAMIVDIVFVIIGDEQIVAQDAMLSDSDT
jgi:hypothetical protein